MKFYLSAFVIALFSFRFAYGQVQSTPTNLNELLDAVEEKSAEIQKARSQYEVIKERLVLASQIPNPEISFGRWKGKAGSRTWQQADATLIQPLELGGKRGRRIDVAESEIKRSSAQVDALVIETRLKTIFSVYRLRQLNDELHFLEEAKETFARLVQNYKSRPQMSPEQSTSMFVFSLARNDYELRLTEMIAELNTLDKDLKILTGYSSEDLKDILPARINSWPKLDADKELDSPTLRILSAQTMLSENELKLAKADIWPTVNIGPSYTSQNQFGEQANIWGVVVSFPIPVLNQNDGARAIASKSIFTNRKFYDIEKSVLSLQRESLKKTYLNSVAVLEKQADDSMLRKNHTSIEKSFLRGLITSALVIESHRQMFDSRKLYHQRELDILDVYYQLVLMEGGKVEAI